MTIIRCVWVSIVLRIGCYNCCFLCSWLENWRTEITSQMYMIFVGTESDSDSVLFNEFLLHSLCRAIVTPEFPRLIHLLLIRTVTAHKKLFVSKFDTLFLYCSLVAATPSESEQTLYSQIFLSPKKADFFSLFCGVISICTILFVWLNNVADLLPPFSDNLHINRFLGIIWW